jgi:uncharacterized protein YjiS (DUF1127 family)
MSIAVNETATVRSGRLRLILDWLRHAKVASSVVQSMNGLSDRDLADIGAKRPDIARAVNHEVHRLRLLDLGWQQPYRPQRR